jgi:hypothetical protein
MTWRQSIASGGWSIFGSMRGGPDLGNRVSNAVLRGNGKNAWFGWPKLPKLEALRDQWRRLTDAPAQSLWQRICSARRSRTHPRCRKACIVNRFQTGATQPTR